MFKDPFWTSYVRLIYVLYPGGNVNIFPRWSKTKSNVYKPKQKLVDKNWFNPLQPGVAYLYPLKTLENLKVSGCFQGV